MKTGFAALALGASVLAMVQPAAVRAQAGPAASADRQFSIAAGDLAAALQAWSRVTGREILFRVEDVANKQTAGVQGRQAPLAALQALLVDTGLQFVTTGGGAVAIRPLAAASEADKGATPEILVTARQGWSLNTGIERTQDDSQPFIVMDRAEIERSGAPTLEAFLRNQLNVNTSPISGDQVNTEGVRRPIGTSAINLRGIGLRDTLILIDGRRQPGVNIGSGDITQPSITGIPIAAVERIEVLASSASGIYGSGASGGVINIVMRRDFKGGELALNYQNTTDFAYGQGRIDLTAGIPLEGGRTRVSLTANWTKSDPMLYGDRDNLRQEGLNRLLNNNPAAFVAPFVLPPIGTAVNFKSFNSSMLRLKPQYGGTQLATNYGTIPAGYAGLARNGVAPLLAALGTYNFVQPDTAYGFGSRARLLFPSEQLGGSLAIRRDFNDMFTAYAEVGASRLDATSIISNTVQSFNLAASAPNNPFVQSLSVFLPGNARYDVPLRNTSSNFRALGGVIMNLPGSWRAVAELSYAKSAYRYADQPAEVLGSTTNLMGAGVIDVMRDLNLDPLQLSYNDVPFRSRRQTGRASTLAPSLRVAGPLPLSLPGGRPQLTVNGEINTQYLDAVSEVRLANSGYTLTYTPSTYQTTKSVYGEIVFPILGGKHSLPLIKTLELRFSARHESTSGNGADQATCTGALQSSGTDYLNLCTPSGATIRRAIARNSHTDPSISLLWSPIGGITFRGSYTTGYLPPRLSQLVPTPARPIEVFVNDPLRGNEIVGQSPQGQGIVDAISGGNPNVLPESSRTWTFGVILQPRFIQGLRFSVDWTALRKRNLYYDPYNLVIPFFGTTQAQFEQFIAQYPGRVTRTAPSDGYSVGRITGLDLSLTNLNALRTDAFDFTVNYDRSLFGGDLSLIGRATYVGSLFIEPFADAPGAEYAGVVERGFSAGTSASGALRFRGNASVQWSKNSFSLGWQTRYMTGYYLLVSKAVVLNQGSARVDSQAYHDFNIGYRFPQRITLRAGVNNVFNTKPPFDSTQSPFYTSSYGDPRLRNFYLGVTKAF